MTGHEMVAWTEDGKWHMRCECGWRGRPWHYFDWRYCSSSHKWHLKHLAKVAS